ncbi:T cell immunoglobulin and mucin domain containing 4 L homeolog isoform X1 [Xenopus laevis]|uniref:T cell immunoglobulin and mucin domain containing 4 L homeolog isoform X1 n=1 Tax=Xenopus laevis TaxID=8355 RepID=UPI001BB1E76F|nr:T cell immunoglobulin and mucin domain containing 4 L homeolog isoform X1 [Xenopus laevis]
MVPSACVGRKRRAMPVWALEPHLYPDTVRNGRVRRYSPPILLLIIPVLTAAQEIVTGFVGKTVVLPCTYPPNMDVSRMCWGRGSCPLHRCHREIIRTRGRNIIQSESERYSLLGNITQGDVSLTLTGATSSDSGIYCCRVRVPGIMNDLKKEIHLEIQESKRHRLDHWMDPSGYKRRSHFKKMELRSTCRIKKITNC